MVCCNAKESDLSELTNLFLICFKDLYKQVGISFNLDLVEDILELLMQNAEVKIIRKGNNVAGFVCYTHNLRELRRDAFRQSPKWFLPWNARFITPVKHSSVERPHILFLGTHPDFRGKGIGSELMNHVFDSAEKPIYAEILKENIPIVELSLKNGFEVESKADFGKVLILRKQ